MQAAGVWLVDASVTALYPKQCVIGNDRNKVDKVMKACWERYVRDVLVDCRPTAILIVGKGVDKAVGKKVRDCLSPDRVKTINQPNAHISRDVIDQDRRTCFDFCSPH